MAFVRLLPFFDFIAIMLNVFLVTTANTIAGDAEMYVPGSSQLSITLVNATNNLNIWLSIRGRQ